jgi:hypothetical protein
VGVAERLMERMNIKLTEDPILGEALDDIEVALGI